MKRRERMKKEMEKEWKNTMTKKEAGFDGLIVTAGIVLIALILIFVFYNTIVPQMKSSIETVSDEIESISSWDAGAATGN